MIRVLRSGRCWIVCCYLSTEKLKRVFSNTQFSTSLLLSLETVESQNVSYALEIQQTLLQVQPGYKERVENAEFAFFSGDRFYIPSFRSLPLDPFLQVALQLTEYFFFKRFILAIPRIFLHLPGNLKSSSFLSPSLSDLFAVSRFQCSLSIALYLVERDGVECCMNRVWFFSSLSLFLLCWLLSKSLAADKT